MVISVNGPWWRGRLFRCELVFVYEPRVLFLYGHVAIVQHYRVFSLSQW